MLCCACVVVQALADTWVAEQHSADPGLPEFAMGVFGSPFSCFARVKKQTVSGIANIFILTDSLFQL